MIVPENRDDDEEKKKEKSWFPLFFFPFSAKFTILIGPN